MTESESRNFRTYYYDKFGFRGVEERKSIEILLKENPLDVEKLRQFCLRFPIPFMYRFHLWKVILGITPRNKESQDFVLKQREEQYKNLHHALFVMRRVDRDTPQCELFLNIFLLDQGSLPYDHYEEAGFPDNRAFLHMARAIISVVDSEVDSYWITSKVFQLFARCRESLQQLVDKSISCLKKEDTDQKLWKHLEVFGIFDCLPLVEWFQCCFSCVLPDSSFQRIWDKVIGGSCMVLVYVVVSIFLTFQYKILKMNSTDKMLAYLQNIPEDMGDIIVSKAIDLWQKNGGRLQVKSDSMLDRSPP
ncbi:hypothetical protein ScPMuIL_016324 [Solemya velum]